MEQDIVEKVRKILVETKGYPDPSCCDKSSQRVCPRVS